MHKFQKISKKRHKIEKKVQRISLLLLLSIILISAMSSCGEDADIEVVPVEQNKQQNQNDIDSKAQADQAEEGAEIEIKEEGGAAEAEPLPEDYQVTSEMTNYVDILTDAGKHIIVELYPDKAPITVENFKKLVAEKYYDGLIFHRIIPGFMIQGGGPEFVGREDKAATIEGEFASNGHPENDIKHVRGVISMARTSVPDSASSQFFIMHQDSPHLDGEYAAFGKVVSGIEEVDRIANVPTGAQDFPENPPVMQSIRFVEKP